MKPDEIDWGKQARQFLEMHGWDVDEHGMGYHPAFPLAEDFSKGEKRMVEFCEDFYRLAWVSYKATIHAYAVLEEKDLPDWIVGEICQKPEDVICNLGYACDGCPYNRDYQDEEKKESVADIMNKAFRKAEK